jgi:hypothetical protein
MDSKLQEAEDSSMGKLWPALLFVIIAAAIAIRLIAAFQSAIVNADAAVYIHQARAIYYGDWEALDDTGVKYLTPYPVLIAVTRFIIGDWIVAATAVSLVFSVLMLIFLHLLSRQFFDRSISLCIFAVFAFHPLFVTAGIDIIKDPLAWCLLVAGMWLFVRGQTGARWLSLTASSILFAFAAWVRVESAIFFFAGAVYFAFFEKADRGKKLVAFLAPALLALVAVVSVVVFTGKGQMAVSRLGEIGPRFALVSEGYQNVRAGLKELSGSPPPGIPAEYFDQIRSLTWLVGLAAILRNAVEAFYPPVFVLFLFGLASTRLLFATDRRTVYFLTSLVFLLLFFYVFIFSGWVLEQRWLASAVVASFLFIGEGIQRVVSWAGDFLKTPPKIAMSAIVGVCLISSLPKIFLSSEQDKSVFVEIGGTMEKLGGDQKELRILSSEHTIRWLSLYANRHVQGAPSPDDFFYSSANSDVLGSDYSTFITSLRAKDVDYFVWVEKQWPSEAFDFWTSNFASDLHEVGVWHHADTGKVVLFQVVGRQ